MLTDVVGKKKKKVLGFDSWTGGVHHFSRLLPAFQELSIDCVVAHIGSWGNEPLVSSEQRIGELIIRDISYYKNNSLEAILESESPDLVILLSTDTFAHRAFIRYCRIRSIPTLNLYHGLVSVQDTSSATYGAKVSRVSHIRFIAARISKLMRFTLPCYSHSLVVSHATSKDWFRFLFDMYCMATGNGSLVSASDARTDRAAVYAPVDVSHAMQRYGFRREEVSVVGNPDLLQFGLTQRLIESSIQGAQLKEFKVMYIETGYSSVGMFYRDVNEFASHLKQTAHALKSIGYQMQVKLKPRQPLLDRHFIDDLESVGIEFVSNENFITEVRKCTACIVEATSLAIVPALLGTPLFLAKYGALQCLQFGSVLSNYPRSVVIDRLSLFSNAFRKELESSDSIQFKQWINEVCGPLPPEKMPARVAEVVRDMIEMTDKLDN